jgi:hypothetical protein
MEQHQSQPINNIITVSGQPVGGKPALGSLTDKSIATREDVLRTIVGLKLKPIFRRQHLKREVIIGLVGLRGDGKSGSGAVIALLDYMLSGSPVWSNMPIQTAIRVDDETAISMTNGAMHKGGVVSYVSQTLDKKALLRFDPQYHDGCYFIDEINMEFAEARRAMSNTNLFMDRVAQQLRKYQNSLIYTVINEMFIDSRMRELTDIFIRSEDVALSVEGLKNRKQPGIDFKWTIYPMSGYLCGRENSYYITKKPLPPVYLHFEPWRGIYDDKLAQAVGKTKYGIELTGRDGDAMQTTVQITQSPDLTSNASQWQWLEDMVNQKMATFDEDGNRRRFIREDEVMNYPEIRERKLSKIEVSHALRELFNIPSILKKYNGLGYTTYILPLEDQLEKDEEN